MKPDKCDSKLGFFEQTTVFTLLFAFVFSKCVLVWIPQDWLRHLLVAGVLFLLPNLVGQGQLPEKVRGIRTGKITSADSICLVYLVVPILLNFIFLPARWQLTIGELANWIFSEVGFFSIIAAPLAEEYFFRGWLLAKQVAASGTEMSRPFLHSAKICYSNALIFWILHMPVDVNLWKDSLLEGQIPMSPGPFLLGFVTCAMTLRTGNLRSAILFHALANATGPLWWPLLANDLWRSIFYN